ncbi:MAG: FAD-binding protein [Nitriliruptoraceae bacterium]|nr:FAD-binding protein [Nitriliruptoraceae bacterium]
MNRRDVTTDVLVIGAGAAGMYAAAEARRQGARVILLDKSMVGRGGATIMAQMTVAAAVGHAEDDSWQLHYADTLESGRGLNNEQLSALMCQDGPPRILESWERGVNWAQNGDKLDQVKAPGHSRKRCCYVGALQTGTGVVRGLKKELRRQEVESHDTTVVTDLIQDDQGAVVGAAALEVKEGVQVAFWAPSVILACGGLTELYARNSASVNMTGDAYALALGVQADLVDMEMVQFFPIANLAPRTIGLDPIMWDPFRYRLGGKLLNGEGEEFIERYAGVADEGTYTATRDVVTYGILKEVEEGRGSPAGGAWLDFTDLTREEIRDAFPAAYDRLLEQGIDVSERAVEVAPTAHYTIGGVRVDIDMRTNVPGLFAAGEAVGGQHGANRLSGNALTEAFVFGARAGEAAGGYAVKTVGGTPEPDATASAAMDEALATIAGVRGRNHDSDVFLPALRSRLKDIMWRNVGPFRDQDRLEVAREQIAEVREEFETRARVDQREAFNLEWQEWFELRGMLDVADLVRTAALARTDSRGAHQRDDFPQEDERLLANTVTRRTPEGSLDVRWEDVVTLDADPASWTPPPIDTDPRERTPR